MVPNRLAKKILNYEEARNASISIKSWNRRRRRRQRLVREKVLVVKDQARKSEQRKNVCSDEEREWEKSKNKRSTGVERTRKLCDVGHIVDWMEDKEMKYMTIGDIL